MNRGLVKVLKKTAKVIAITLVSLLLILFLLPYIMPGTISKKIKSFVNRSIDGKIEFSKARLSFFNHFPSLTLTWYDFSSTGSAPFQNEKLLSAGEIAMGISIPALFRGEINIKTNFICRWKTKWRYVSDHPVTAYQVQLPRWFAAFRNYWDSHKSYRHRRTTNSKSRKDRQVTVGGTEGGRAGCAAITLIIEHWALIVVHSPRTGEIFNTQLSIINAQ